MQSLIDEIKNTPADRLCGLERAVEEGEEGEEEKNMYTLESTWLPLPLLQNQRSRYMQDDEYFPFLALEDSDAMSPEQISAKWAFLVTTFCVGREDNTIFLLNILKSICHSNGDESDRPDRIIDLYIAIDAKCTAAIDRVAERNMVR